MCLGFVGSLIGSDAQADALEQQAAFDRHQAALEIGKASYESGIAKDDAKRTLANQAATFASNGIQLTGSAADVMQDSARSADMDIAAIRYGGETRAENLRFSAQQNLEQAKSIRKAAPIIAGATALTDFANLAVGFA